MAAKGKHCASCGREWPADQPHTTIITATGEWVCGPCGERIVTAWLLSIREPIQYEKTGALEAPAGGAN